MGLLAVAADVYAAEAFVPVTITSQAIDQAGRERMLAQRMAKAWLMQGLRIAPEQSRTILAESRERFDQQLTELNRFVPNDDVRRAPVEPEHAWRDYRAALAAPARREHAGAVYDASEAVQHPRTGSRSPTRRPGERRTTGW